MEINNEVSTAAFITYQDVYLLLEEISKLKKGSELMQEVTRDLETSQIERAHFHFKPVYMSNRFYHMIQVEESIRLIHKVQARESTCTISSEDRLSLCNNNIIPRTSKSERTKNYDSSQDIDELDKAVIHFVNVIDRFLHAYDHNKFEYELIETIVRTCPKLLTRKNENGQLPFHCVMREGLDIDTHLLTLFASVGSQNGLGRLTTARGGILLDIHEQIHVQVPIKAKNVLQTLVECKEIKTLRGLLNCQKPLLVKEDIKKYHLLKYAVMEGPFDRMYDATLEIVKLIIGMDSSCVYHPDEIGNIPLHYSLNDSAIFSFIIKSAMKFQPFHESIGGLFSSHVSGQHVIDFMLGIKDGNNWYQEPVSETQRLREKRHLDDIESIMSPFQTVTILHRTISLCPHLTPDILQRFPYSVYLRDDKNRLPIHHALDKGLKWHELAFVLHANCNFLEAMDPVKKLPLFALAAVTDVESDGSANDTHSPLVNGKGRSCDLRTIYYLIRRNPELLFIEL